MQISQIMRKIMHIRKSVLKICVVWSKRKRHKIYSINIVFFLFLKVA